MLFSGGSSNPQEEYTMRKLSIVQRVVIAAGVLLMILSLLFPCWQSHIIGRPMYGGVQFDICKQFQFRSVFDPPDPSGYNTEVDLTRLLTQLAVILISTIGLVIILPFKPST